MVAQLLSTSDAARLIGVGTTSVKRWADTGLLDCVRTAGGHRRFTRDSLDRFIRMQSHEEPMATEVDRWLDTLASEMSHELALVRARNRLGSWRWRRGRARPRPGRGRPTVGGRRAEHRRGAHPHRTLVPRTGADLGFASVAAERADLSSRLRRAGGSHPRALSGRALPSRTRLGVGLAGRALANRGDHRARAFRQSDSNGGSIRDARPASMLLCFAGSLRRSGRFAASEMSR